MRVILAGLIRCATWYVTLFWTITYFLGTSRTVAAVAVPFIIAAGTSLGTWRFYRGIHRRRRSTHQARFRGPVRRAGAAGPRCRAGHDRCACPCPRCAGPGLNLSSRGLWQQWHGRLAGSAVMLEDELSEPLAGGIRLGYVPAEPLGEGGLGTQLTALTASAMTLRLHSNPPASSAAVSGSGYTRGGFAQSFPAPAHVRPVTVNQPPPPGPLPHPAACQCVVCMRGVSAGPIPGCNCPVCVPAPALSLLNCGCPSCQSYRQRAGGQPSSSAPPARPKPKAGWGARGMDGFDGAPLVAGTALGYRWWTMRAPQLHLNPASAGENWEPGLLRGVKDFWQPGVNQARCQAGGVKHPFGEIPHEACGDGFWAYWEIQQHDMGAAGSLPVVGVVKASGQVIMGPRGFRAQKAEIVALHLPFRIQPDLPAVAPPPARPLSPSRPQHRFTGRVISLPGAPPVPPSLGGPPVSVRPPPPPPPEPEPPTDEEIRAAADLAEAWMAVIADRLAVTYPGAEVCATLDLMKAKYPVTSEYAPPQVQEQVIHCPYCGMPCDADNIHAHVVNNHSL